MNLSNLSLKITGEIDTQFWAISNWLKQMEEIDMMDTNQIIQRKNFLIIGIYSANEYLLECCIEYYFLELYNQIQTQTGRSSFVDIEKEKLRSYIKHNNNWSLEGFRKMLNKIIIPGKTELVINNIKGKMSVAEYDSFIKELKEIQDLRNKLAHSSVNFLKDTAGAQFDIDNHKVTEKIDRLNQFFKTFSGHLYEELNSL